MQYTKSNSKGRIFFVATLKENNVLHCEWIGYINEADRAIEACLMMVELVKKHGCQVILNDNSQQTGPWPAINDWLENIWKPALARVGIKYFAHVLSDSVFTQVSAQKVVHNHQLYGIEFNTFNSIHAALYWVNAKKTKHGTLAIK